MNFGGNLDSVTRFRNESTTERLRLRVLHEGQALPEFVKFGLRNRGHDVRSLATLSRLCRNARRSTSSFDNIPPRILR